MQLKTQVFYGVLCLFTSACATTNRNQSLVWTGASALVGGGAGYLAAPTGERPIMHAAFMGSVAAAVASVVGLYLFDEQKRSEEFERKFLVAQKELEVFRSENIGEVGGLLHQSHSLFEKEIPKEYEHLIRPGQWSVYRLDQWILQGEGTLIHQDRMVKLIPPQVQPKTLNHLPTEVVVQPTKQEKKE